MRVYLVSKPDFQSATFQRFLRDEGIESFDCDWDTNVQSAEKLTEAAGRLCYMSFEKPRPGGNRKYIEHILEVGHGSVLEHADFVFILTGVSRSLTHELVRHRAGTSFSQLSQRYVDESDAEMIVPPDMEGDELCIGIARDAWEYAKRAYDRIFIMRYRHYLSKSFVGSDIRTMSIEDLEKLVSREQRTTCRKSARQEARCVLPNATETKIVVKGNIRTWRTILELRGSMAADAEIRKLAIEIYKQLNQAAPVFFSDFELHMDPEPHLTNVYHKV